MVRLTDPKSKGSTYTGGWAIERAANLRSALDARMLLCFHTQAHWPGACESERWT